MTDRIKERTCFITRIRAPTQAMIRFVVDPGGYVVADLKNNLPGRGAWLSMSREIVEKAIEKKAFSRALKQEVQVVADLANTIDCLLVRAALGSLSIVRKSGAVVTGASKVDSSLRSGRVCMVLHSREATENGKRKIARVIAAAIHTAKNQKKQEVISVLNIFTAHEMTYVFGSSNPVMHAAVYKGSVADGFIKRAQQLAVYRNESMINWKAYGKTVKGTVTE